MKRLGVTDLNNKEISFGRPKGLQKVKESENGVKADVMTAQLCHDLAHTAKHDSEMGEKQLLSFRMQH